MSLPSVKCQGTASRGAGATLVLTAVMTMMNPGVLPVTCKIVKGKASLLLLKLRTDHGAFGGPCCSRGGGSELLEAPAKASSLPHTRADAPPLPGLGPENGPDGSFSLLLFLAQ